MRDSGAEPIARGKDAGELDYIMQNVSAAILRNRVILQEPVIFQYCRYARICRPGQFCLVSRVDSALRAPDPKLRPTIVFFLTFIYFFPVLVSDPVLK